MRLPSGAPARKRLVNSEGGLETWRSSFNGRTRGCGPRHAGSTPADRPVGGPTRSVRPHAPVAQWRERWSAISEIGGSIPPGRAASRWCDGRIPVCYSGDEGSSQSLGAKPVCPRLGGTSASVRRWRVEVRFLPGTPRGLMAASGLVVLMGARLVRTQEVEVRFLSGPPDARLATTRTRDWRYRLTAGHSSLTRAIGVRLPAPPPRPRAPWRFNTTRSACR